jgi:sugar lactone lactonase YvrE
MSVAGSIEIFDNRECALGEGPTVKGPRNNLVSWVDIYSKRVLSRDIESGTTAEFNLPEIDKEITFAIPRNGGGEILGIIGGPYLRDPNGHLTALKVWDKAFSSGKSQSLRWNDAKVAPTGSLWAGTMAGDGTLNAGSLFCISKNGKSIKEELDNISISNGLDWSPNGKKFYFVDTMLFRLDSFDFQNDIISGRKVLIQFDKDKDGFPDGLTVDSEGCVWLTFWSGGKVLRISPEGEILETLILPVSGPTSCVFAGENLDLLVITTAKSENEPGSGRTLCVETKVQGKLNHFFPF